MKFKPRDIIAIVAFAICAVLLIVGIDGEVKAFMGFIIGYYFRDGVNGLKPKKEHEYKR